MAILHTCDRCGAVPAIQTRKLSLVLSAVAPSRGTVLKDFGLDVTIQTIVDLCDQCLAVALIEWCRQVTGSTVTRKASRAAETLPEIVPTLPTPIQIGIITDVLP